MRRATWWTAVVVAAISMVAASCGDDSSEGSGGTNPPVVEIVDLSVDGSTATLTYRVDDDGDAVAVSIDWGDATAVEEFQGIGDLTSSHTYADGVADPIVTVVVTDDDGNSVRAGRTAVLGPAEPSPSSSTSSTSTSTSTSTNTSTTTTSTTTTTTTSTLPPEAIEKVIPLDPQAARSRDGSNRGDWRTRFNDNGVEVFATTRGFDGSSRAEANLTWEIQPEEFDALGDSPRVSVLLEPVWSIELTTGPNRGRSAVFEIELSGTAGGQEIGSGGDFRQIGNGDSLDVVVSDPIGFGSSLAPGNRSPIEVTLTVRCFVTPGETLVQIGEESTCDALEGSNGLTVNELRLTITRTEGL